MRIKIPPSLVDLVDELEQSARQDIEVLKGINEFDPKLVELCIYRESLDPGIVEPEALEVHFSETIDLIIQVIAHCENPTEVTHVTEVLRYVGRIRRKKILLPEEFDGLLRNVIREIDEKYGYVNKGVNDRISVRRKAKAMCRKIEEALNHRGA